MTTRFVPTHVRSAIEVVATDRDRTASERKAFARFSDRLSEFSVTGTASKTNPPRHTPVQTALDQTSISSSESQIIRVCKLYRETIMDVDHYSEEYGDSLGESISEEFGSETAAALANTNHLTPQLRDRLLEASTRAQKSRHALLQGLKHEHSALQNADETLSELGADLDDILSAQSLQTWPDEELTTTQKNLHERERECNRLATDRQTTLHEQRVPSTHHIDLEFIEYLYRSLPVTYPVLTDITSLADTLRTACDDIDDTLSSRESSHIRSPSASS
ncbi:DUF7260 family protein [Halococcus sp. AFM35]|uniref:DUF7260 family protein n=1 Tax=Halococcus sp. AFM35 TaxID=3421653 RepID=UPI003EBA76CA